MKLNQTVLILEGGGRRGVFKAGVIRLEQALKVGRLERNKDKLYDAYGQGYDDAMACYVTLCSYLNQ